MRAVVVMLREGEYEEEEAEVLSLATTAEYEVLKVFVQTTKPRARYLVGTGKVEEIKSFVKGNGAELVIFENFLRSRQIMSLEEALGVPVIDRFDLILNVFEKHAQSREAMLQIELARLTKRIPYIKMYLSRRVREEHPGFGGSGEFIIHSTLGAINKRIKNIEKKLERFQERAGAQRERRRRAGKIVSLAGYTNAGKTTLLNALTGAEKEVRDELFTTLRTKTSAIVMGDQKVFVNDTVGFIRDLPHELIYAFRATLSDIRGSDLVLVVLDASDTEEEFARKREVCENTLVEIGADRVPVLYVLNKIDVVAKRPGKSPRDSIRVSAKYGKGIEGLKEKIASLVGED